YAADADDGERVRQIKAWMDRLVRRNHEPVNVQEGHQNHPGRQACKQWKPALERALQQAEERDEEMKQQQRDGNRPPGTVDALRVPGDFVLQVAGPDDQELVEREIGPQKREREHQVAEIVELARLDRAVDGLDVPEPAQA